MNAILHTSEFASQAEAVDAATKLGGVPERRPVYSVETVLDHLDVVAAVYEPARR